MIQKQKYNNIDNYYEQANLLREQTDYEEAIKIYDKIITLYPNQFEAYCFKGDALEGLGYTSGDINKFFEAIKSYDKAIEIKPDYAIAYEFKGILWEEIGRIQSRKVFDEFYKLRPDIIAERKKLMVSKEMNNDNMYFVYVGNL